jgi:hypothetical protein
VVQTLLDGLGPGLDVEGVLGDLPRDTQHFCQFPHKNILVALEEVDELAFLFGAQVSPDLDGLGWVLGVDSHGLGILSGLQGVGHGGHGRASRGGRCAKAQLLKLRGGDRGGGQLNATMIAVQSLLSFNLHGDDADGSRYLELEVGIARNSHELDRGPGSPLFFRKIIP